ncbi:MAG: polysaccharide pyruvyl transferase family protein [Lachnospiraceae bacterium]|nr:polysaccharide pyruvyl transferase family protein [Lachnospiraceae bacterium]
MKKIGLCVCYDTKNFGSQLQVLATQKAVEELGYDYEVIRYKKKLTPVFMLQSLPRLFNPYFMRGKLSGIKKRRIIKKHEEIAKQVSVRNKRFDNFVDSYFLKLSKPYVGYEALKKNAKKYDGVLTGSDQLWLPGNLGSHFYTQEFVPDNVNKVAYATSFGVGSIPWFQKKRTRNYLNRFQYLSSRELQGSKIIKELTGRESVTVADPTLLFSGDEWFDYIPDNKVIEGKYIFCYFLGDNPKHREISEELKAKTGFEIVTIPFLDNFVERDLTFGDKPLYDVDAADFVNLIRNAEYILTDSFHGSVFSILNHKKFVTFNRFMDDSKDSRNSRIDSLCELLGLSQRRYKSDIIETADREIDYEAVDKRVEKLRINSKAYLCDALKGSDK